MHLSLIAILLGLAIGLTLRQTQSPPQNPPTTPRPKTTLTPKTHSTTSFPIPTNPQPLSPEAQQKAGLYLFLHQASPQELLTHWQALLADKNNTEESLADFAALWISRDPDSALLHLSKSKFQDLYWWTLARHDPQKALAQADPHNPELLAKIIHAIGTTDPDLAITLLTDDLSHKNRISALGGIIAGLFKRDPHEALDFAFQHRSKNNYYLYSHLQKWAAHSPHDAFAWALTHPEIHSETLPSVGSLLFKKDPDFILAELAKLPSGKAKASLLRSQAIHLAPSDPQAALAFAKSHPPYLQKDILKTLGHTISEKAPHLTLDLLSQIFTHELDPNTYATSADPFDNYEIGSHEVLLNKWAKDLIRENPQSVLEIASQADSNTSPSFSTSRQVLSIWLDQNPTAAQEWLAEQPPGQLRDHLYGETLNDLSFNDPKNLSTHLNLSQKIQDPEIRQSSLNEIFNTLSFEHEEKFDALLKDHQLTPAQQKAYDQRANQE